MRRLMKKRFILPLTHSNHLSIIEVTVIVNKDFFSLKEFSQRDQRIYDAHKVNSGIQGLN